MFGGHQSAQLGSDPTHPCTAGCAVNGMRICGGVGALLRGQGSGAAQVGPLPSASAGSSSFSARLWGLESLGHGVVGLAPDSMHRAGLATDSKGLAVCRSLQVPTMSWARGLPARYMVPLPDSRAIPRATNSRAGRMQLAMPARTVA